ncbi:hypothetical protein [Oryzobacter telluris]|uniref:hypothetical protein n=1 Tax=Oryzobacter telluris TaxID=3149179 RepID=UPI00370D8071
MAAVWPYLTAILPTILVSILFYFLIRSMIEGDRRERLAQRQFEAAEDARRSSRTDAAVSTEDDANGTGTAQENSSTPS